MTRTLVFGVGALALAGVALYSLSSPDAEESTPPEGAEAAVAPSTPTAQAEEAQPPADRRARPRPRQGSLETPPVRLAPKGETKDLEGVVIVAMEDFEDALTDLQQLDPNKDPAGVARAVREVELAFQRLENETDPENPAHRRLHNRATQELKEKLSVIAGPRGPKPGIVEPEPAPAGG